MNERAVEKELLQWHQAFYAGLQIELEQEADKLIFENEHQLGMKPMGIDVLIIKKDTEEPIHKNIGRIFRKHNIIEYKSPEDYLSIDDFYKVYGYCCFYKADVTNVNSIKVDELTISFVCNRYPEKLITHLRQVRGCSVELVENGIYQIIGDIFSMQIIIRANQEIFEEVRDVCEALEELMKDKIEERAEERAKELAEERAKELAKEQINTAEIRVTNLMATLLKQGRSDDIIKAAENKEYQKKLFEEFGL